MSQQLQGLTYAAGDLSLAARIQQTTATAAFVHRLTPTASFTLTVSDQKTSDFGALAGNELRLVSAGLSDTLTRLITGTLTLRHARFTSPSQPYTESAIIGSLGMTF